MALLLGGREEIHKAVCTSPKAYVMLNGEHQRLYASLNILILHCGSGKEGVGSAFYLTLGLIGRVGGVDFGEAKLWLRITGLIAAQSVATSNESCLF